MVLLLSGSRAEPVGGGSRYAKGPDATGGAFELGLPARRTQRVHAPSAPGWKLERRRTRKETVVPSALMAARTLESALNRVNARAPKADQLAFTST